MHALAKHIMESNVSCFLIVLHYKTFSVDHCFCILRSASLLQGVGAVYEFSVSISTDKHRYGLLLLRQQPICP